jgi:uncharacterized protein YjeT (DUF2065 family)
MDNYNILIGSIVLVVMGALMTFLPERGRRRVRALSPSVPSRAEVTGWIGLAVGAVMLVVWLSKHL